MKLTIGMPHYDDYRGVYMTVQALKLYQDMTDVEVLVVDNSPNHPSGKQCQVLLDHFKGDFNTRYVPMVESRGPAHAKNEVIRQASGDTVLVMDCHVMLGKDAVRRLKEYPIDDSFYTGPLLMDDCRTVCTHFDMLWRGGMWGIWSHAWQHPDGTYFSVYHNTDKYCEYFDFSFSRKKLNLDLPVIKYDGTWQARLLAAGCKMVGTNPDDPPFKVPAQGCGLFVVKKDSWLGFNDSFYGFGGEEGYIHAKYLREGRPTICLPFMRWNHYFRRGNEVPYEVVMQDRIRNYVIGFQELGLDYTPIKSEFVPKHMSEREWEALVHNPVAYVRQGAQKASEPPSNLDNPEKLYNWAKDQNNKEYPPDYLTSLRSYSSVSPKILDISDKSFSTLAMMAGLPETLHCYKKQRDRAIDHIGAFSKCDFKLTAESIFEQKDLPNYDLIYVEPSPATHDQLFAILMFLGGKSNRYIAISGVTQNQFKGVDNKGGFAYALREFCKLNPDWFAADYVPQGAGLAVLSKNPVDKPPNELRIWPMENGPGHFLKQNLKKYLGIESTPNCSCNKRALMMDIQGPKWCRENVPLIVSWLKEEYERRRNSTDKVDKLGMVASMLPFSESAATILVKTSIRQSEKCQSKK
jgi:glycosyltransferase involved in cell wall biosynthesis